MSQEKHSTAPVQKILIDEAAPLLERVLFKNRPLVLIILLALTALFGYGVTLTKLDSSIEKYIPTQHEYIKNFLIHADDMKSGVANIKVSLATKEGDIFNAEYQDVLKNLNDKVSFINGVDLSIVRSLWTANTRWTEVTEEGFQGGTVIPSNYDGSQRSLDQVRQNILRSGELGRLVANDFKSSIIDIPLVEKDPITGGNLNYQVLSRDFENIVREGLVCVDASTIGLSDGMAEREGYKVFTSQLQAALESKTAGFDVLNFEHCKVSNGTNTDYSMIVKLSDKNSPYNVYMTGTPKKLGDLMDGAISIGYFFLAAIFMTAFLLFLYSRCPRGTIIPILASLVAVVWQLGALGLLGYTIDLYSVLVPFLVFAIGISHGVQIINGIAIESGKGADKLTAARRAFRGLYAPGMLALISDGMGFLTLLFIDIGVIQELAIAAGLGVAIIIVTNLVLLPIVLSYVGISDSGIKNAQRGEKSNFILWRGLSYFASRKTAPVAIVVAVLLVIGATYVSRDLQIGDLDKGAPELRADSRYNLDNDFMVSNYSTSSDVFVVMAETPQDMCVSFKVFDTLNRFMWHMENVEGVQSAVSVSTISKLVGRAMNEGNIKWSSISRNDIILSGAVQRAQDAKLINSTCSMLPVVIYLNDHKAETLERVVDAVEEFKAEYDDQVDEKYYSYSQDEINQALDAGELDSVPVRLQLASGNAGIEAATNQVIESAQSTMLFFVYGVVIFLCFLTFRSIRAVACIVLPLMVTSILSEAIMVWLGIGIKVATLPVIALGVGIGVDYGIYIYSRLEVMLIHGKNLQQAFLETLRTTGKAVGFTGITLAIGVATWIFSPIKFQADMGVLLTFMFLWNMLGALILLPAIACFILKPEEIIARYKKRNGDIMPAG